MYIYDIHAPLHYVKLLMHINSYKIYICLSTYARLCSFFVPFFSVNKSSLRCTGTTQNGKKGTTPKKTGKISHDFIAKCIDLRLILVMRFFSSSLALGFFSLLHSLSALLAFFFSSYYYYYCYYYSWCISGTNFRTY